MLCVSCLESTSNMCSKNEWHHEPISRARLVLYAGWSPNLRLRRWAKGLLRTSSPSLERPLGVMIGKPLSTR